MDKRDLALRYPSEDICPLCHKSIQNDKSRIRHIRYCRERAKEGHRSRRKSCAPCVKAKARCNTVLPRCSRCEKKGVSCLYNEASSALPSNSASVSQYVAADSLPSETPFLLTGMFTVAPPGHDLLLDGATQPIYNYEYPHQMAMTHCTNLSRVESGIDVGLELSRPPYALTSFNEPPDYAAQPLLDGYADWNVVASPHSIMPHINFFKDRVILGSFTIRDISPVSFELHAKAVSQRFPKGALNYDPSIGRAYITSVLRSYPMMLLHDDGRLIPFIHPQTNVSLGIDSYAREEIQSSTSQPLVVCASIMRMYSAMSKANATFIWTTIQTEQQRMELECHNYNEQTLVAAFQSITIYAILRLLDESVDVDSNGNTILTGLIRTTQKMSERVQATGFISYLESQGQMPTWHNWILMESLRRTTITLVLLIHIFNIDFGPEHQQCGGFTELLLPCSKKLWQAPDRVTWEAVYQESLSGGVQQSGMGLKYRDLLPNLGGVDDGSKSRMQRLSKWFAEVDDFGTLVTMAMSAL